MTQFMQGPAAEYEDEFEVELEDEGESLVGGLSSLTGSVLGEAEDEDEWEDELEGEYEDELELELEDENEDFSSLSGLSPSIAAEYEDELEGDREEEAEQEAEEFFKNIGRVLKIAKPFLKTIAPLVATAVGGPAAGAVARAVASQFESEGESEVEAELESLATAPVGRSEALAEQFAANAASAKTEAEAEAFAGAAVSLGLSQRDRRELEQVLPALLRGTAAITRILYRDRRTRPGLRLIPSIARATGAGLIRQAGGATSSPAAVGRLLAVSSNKVLRGRGLASGLQRHSRGLAYHRAYNPQAARSRGVPYVRRTPLSNKVIGDRSGPGRPRAGFVRVVTPVRIPAKGSHPARTVRVVSDVRLPRGGRPAGRPSTVASRRVS
ncbi:hypothetical protein [Rhodococcoides yunnanense]|uniref:hypothetical protein n=1 Tax=Rhodococcoides yunnanense TaxID=278209 RepID=UPI000934E503|nr:hypothetical protein [Rhodococcus yunnanensis]